MARAQNGGPHPVDTHVGRRVCERRVSMGYNQTQLAKALDLTFQQIQKYEKGSNRISASKLWDAAAFLEVPVSYFFEGLDGFAPEAETTTQSSTGHASEIGRLSPQLTPAHQRLALELIRTLARRGAAA